MTEQKALELRIGELEFQFAHVQRGYDQLNEVVTAQASLIEQLQRRISRIESVLAELKRAPEKPADPLDEKPPHY